jgi:hypothetical protein
LNMALQTDISIMSQGPDLRKFGRVMAGAFGVVALIIFWRSGWTQTPWVEGFGIAAAAFLALSIVWPKALAPIEWAWMKLAMVLNYVMTRVLLTLVFALAVTPIALVFKLLRKDLLDRRFDRGSKTYWVEPEKDGPWTRPEKPY